MGNINKYKDFSGILIKKKDSIFQSNVTFFVLQNQEKCIKIRVGRSYAVRFNIGQGFRVGHMGKQLVNIYPLFNGPDSPILSKESYFCKLYSKEIGADKCKETQEMLRKPEEVETLPFYLDEAHSFCPNCPYNQCR